MDECVDADEVSAGETDKADTKSVRSAATSARGVGAASEEPKRSSRWEVGTLKQIKRQRTNGSVGTFASPAKGKVGGAPMFDSFAFFETEDR